MQLLSLLKELSLHPKNAEELKGLILQLAVQGKLTAKWREDNPDVEPASELLMKVEAEKKQLIKEKVITKEKPLSAITDEVIPFELPNQWEWCRLRDVGYTMTGGTPSKSNPSFFGADIPFIKPGDILNWKIDYHNEGLSFKGRDKLNRTAPAGSVLMVCLGTIGKCAIINQACCFNQQINSITPLGTDSTYLLSVLSSNTTIALLNKGKWENIPIPLPPLQEQKAIVEIVNQLFEEVEQLEALTKKRISLKENFVTSALRRLTETENTATEWNWLKDQFSTFFTEQSSVKKLRETILQLAVQGKLTAKWRANNPSIEPASELLKRIDAEKQQLIAEKKIKKEAPLPPVEEDEIPYELPEGWVWCRFAEIVINRDGERRPITKSDRIAGKYDYYGASGVIDKVEDYLFEDDLLLIGEDGANLINRSTPIAFFARGKYWVNNHAHVLDSPYMEVLEYLEVYINGISLVDYITGMAQPKMPQKRMNIIPVPLPSLEEQKSIVEKVNALMALCDELEQQIETSHTQVEQLMQSCLKEVFEIA
jgi:type I restriction enzyme S subunit